MHLITHSNHITPDMSDQLTDELIECSIRRFDQIAQETGVPPIIILVKPGDDITGPDYSFIGNRVLPDLPLWDVTNVAVKK